MKFYREINHESARGFSMFFAVFSMVLMALGFGTGMPWYFCFLFVAFSLLCIQSFIDCGKCTLQGGIISYYRFCLKKQVKVNRADYLIVTEYMAPMRARGAKNYTMKREGKRVNRAYLTLVETQNEKNILKCDSNHVVKAYYKKDIVFSMMYTEEILAALLEGFEGKVYVLKSVYRDFEREIDGAANRAGYDFGKVFVFGSKVANVNDPKAPALSAPEGENNGGEGE